ncbi:phosphatase PAP2 family protein [Patescibacteria group bacterium]|nr:phosphatase PAP2 family protein [Patescibacteria group bacterium]
MYKNDKKNFKKNLILPILIISLFVLMFILSILFNLDFLVNQKISSLWGGFLEEIFLFFGEYLAIILVLSALVLSFNLFIEKRYKESFVLIMSLILGFLLENILKLILQRARPNNPLLIQGGYSFPSGHALFSIILFSLCIYFYSDKIKNKIFKIGFIFLNFLLIFFVSFTRVYLNVHWITDIFGAYLLGITIILLSLSALKNNFFIKNKNKK